MNLILLVRVIFEGPIWFALISYRLQWQLATIFLQLSVFYEVFLRSVLWIFSFYLYIDICWMRFVYTPWDLVWRIAYPIVCCLQVITQLWTIWIHYKLTCKSRKDFQQRRTILALNSQVDNRDNILRLNAEMFTHNRDSNIVIENSRNMQ
jgi:hypothetical protein